MITEKDLLEAIAECQGERNPNANTCIKLAAFYTIRNELFGEKTISLESRDIPSYSYDAGPEPDIIDYYGDTDFAHAIDGRRASEIWPVMDELMTTLKLMQPRLYDGVMRKLG